MRKLGAMTISGLGFSVLLLSGCPPTFPDLCAGAECGDLGDAAPNIDGNEVPSRVVGVSLGDHNCALLANGHVTCWDVQDNQFRSLPVPGLDDIVQLSSSLTVACALQRDGRVACWGRGYGGMLGDGHEYPSDHTSTVPVPVKGLTDAIQVKAGYMLACALRRGGRVVCWGVSAIEPGDGTTPPPALEPSPIDGISNASQITVGLEHVCALEAGNLVKCWGLNSRGQTGEATDGAATNRTSRPTIVPSVIDAVEVVAGYEHTCARTASGLVQCWGRTSYTGVDERGLPTAPFSAIPQPVANLTDAVELAAGNYATCARKRNGTIVCWGANMYGELGAGVEPSTASNSDTPMPVKDISDATALSLGLGYACAVAAGGRVECWGSNGTNVLGGSDALVGVPVKVKGLEGAFGVASGKRFSCAIRSDDNRVVCWGSNGYGALGVGIADTDPTVLGNSRATPVLLPPMPNVRSISAADNYACALSHVGIGDGTVRCWGNNSDGVFGRGTADPAMATTPQEVPHLSGVEELSTGRNLVCARDTARKVHCWGIGYNGRTGTPETVPNLEAVQISSGASFACALRSRPGKVACWGVNPSGNLGTGSEASNLKTPADVLNVSDAIHVGAGYRHACAVRSNGQVMCWGGNNWGQLGIGQADNVSHPVPVTVKGLTDAIEVRGAEGTCARKSNGQLVCWGPSLFGVSLRGVDDGTRYAPGAPVSGLVADQFAVGRFHACALTSDYRVVCWGENRRGQLGNDRMLYSSTPITVPVNP